MQRRAAAEETGVDASLAESQPLEGLTFVLTGTLENRTRDEAGAALKALGAKRHGLGFEKDELRGGWSECRIKAHEGRKPRRHRA